MDRRLVLAAVGLALVAWSGAVVRGGFALDDREAILANPVVTGALPASAAFGRDYWFHLTPAGHYRPLATLALRADHALWGEEAAGYHATGALLHAAVVAAAGLVLLRLRAGTSAFVGLLLFAAHPALADSVAWISGRTSMVSCLGGTLALAAATLRRPPLLGLGVALGLLAGLLGKEDAAVFALPALAIAGARSRGALVACAVGVAAALAAYGALRASALGAVLPHAPHAPLASVPLVERLPYGGRAVLEGLRLLVWPLDHPPSYRGSAGFTPAEPPGALAWAGWLAWLGLVAAGGIGMRARRLAGTSAVLAALAALPVLQLVPAGEVFAPRFLYLPLLLGVPAAGALLARLPRAAVALVLALAVPLAVVGAWHRAGVYAGRASYARAVLDHAPDDAGSWNDLGVALVEDGDAAGAREAWRRAVERDPGHGRAWDNLGALALAEGDELEAEECLRRAVAAAPSNPIPLCNLANLYLRTGLVPEAERCYARATALAPGLAPAWRGLGNARARIGDAAGARAALERALALDPADERAARLLAGLVLAGLEP